MPNKELSDKLKAQFKDVAKKRLEEAIRNALKMGFYYEDICEIVAKTINEYSKWNTFIVNIVGKGLEKLEINVHFAAGLLSRG